MLKKNSGFIVFFLAAMTFGMVGAQAQCVPGETPCETDSDCLEEDCPNCVQCIDGFCEENDAYCEAFLGNDCRVAKCEYLPVGDFSDIDAYVRYYETQQGCVFDAPPLFGEAGFPLDCYYCFPPELPIELCGNGVCDSPSEDCSNCPADCKVEGFEGETCPLNTDGQECFILRLRDEVVDLLTCEDGDACTVNTCEILEPQAEAGQCTSAPAGCSLDLDDQCCPAGCFGPPNEFKAGEFPCREAFGDDPEALAKCDINCWPPQECGDGFVQAPETCDPSVPGDQAGLLPDGTEVPDTSCRAPGSENECSFCGDGLIQNPSEECDGANDDACGGLGCGSDCQCNESDLCLTGSGEIVNGELRGNCSTACSLNQHADTNLMLGQILGMLALVFALALGWIPYRVNLTKHRK